MVFIPKNVRGSNAPASPRFVIFMYYFPAYKAKGRGELYFLKFL